jgi:multidrug efflux pump subunit AcrA (membrane-fusion protein)
VGLLKAGQQAQLTTDGGTTVYGTISSVGLISTSSSGTASYPVVVKVTGSPSGLHAGATGTVALIYHQLTGVLTVPTLAVHRSASSSVVYVMSGGKQVTRQVTTGLSSGGLTQIVSGLSEGDQVVVTVPSATGSSKGTSTNRGRFGGGNVFGGGDFSGGSVGGGGFGGGGIGAPSAIVKGGN